MRPYLAIIQDSFREALHSRVLWLLVVVITLLLLLLAPIGYQERLTVDLTDNSVRNWPQFIIHLRDESKKDGTIAAHIASLFDESVRKTLNDFKMFDDGDIQGAMKFSGSMTSVRNHLNKQLQRRDFYVKQVWRNAPLATEEGRVLLDKGVDNCSDIEVARLNRLLLEAAFPEQIEASPQVSLQIRYLTWDVLTPLPFRRDQATKGIESAVAWIMKYFVGVIGVIVAVLVTASVIPQTFDPGSLNLLLSKPISRSLLFLSKFVGGCAFILCNATYLIVGLWAILGLRFGIWDAKLLLTIPIYMFMFAIYYTVSALAGVVWRNPIVSVALSVLFWLVCFLTGMAKWLVETRYIDRQRLVKVVPAGESLIVVNETGHTFAWKPETSKWEKVFQSQMQKILEVPMYFLPSVPHEVLPIGPVYDAKKDRLISIQRIVRGGSQMGQMMVYTGDRSDGWTCSKDGPNASIGTIALFRTPQDELIDVSSTGLYRLVGDLNTIPEKPKFLGVQLPWPSFSPLVPAGPDVPVLLASPAAVAVQPDSGGLVAYSRGTLSTLHWNSETSRYDRQAERVLPLDPGTSVVLAWTGNTVLLGRDDGVLVLYDAENLRERGHWLTTGRQPPRFIEAAPGGRWFAVTLHGGEFWLIDAQNDELTVPRFAASRDISCATFASADEIYVVDAATRVTKYSLATGKSLDRWSPAAGPVELVYGYFLQPVYTIFPKPGDLDDTVDYLLSGRKTVDTGPQDRSELGAARKQLDPWGPVWSSAAFVVVMLGLCCLYLERQEF